MFNNKMTHEIEEEMDIILQEKCYAFEQASKNIDTFKTYLKEVLEFIITCKSSSLHSDWIINDVTLVVSAKKPKIEIDIKHREISCSFGIKMKIYSITNANWDLVDTYINKSITN